CGDEDNGQTSAWYVFSALGFYPVCPVSDEYVIGSPLFEKATLALENGNELIISATATESRQNRYIQSMKVNGQDYDKNYLEYSELIKGGVIDFVLSNEPNLSRGTQPGSFPYSSSLKTSD